MYMSVTLFCHGRAEKEALKLVQVGKGTLDLYYKHLVGERADAIVKYCMFFLISLP